MLLSEEIAEIVPGFPADLQPGDSLRPGGRVAHGALVGMRRIVGSMFPTLAVEPVKLCETWGDLLNLVGGHERRDYRLPTNTYGTGTGFTVRLRPLRPDDMPFLYDAATDPAEGYRWRLRGRTISPEAFHQYLHDGVLAQFIVETLDERAPIGLVMAYNHVPDGGHCAIGLQRALPGLGRGGEMIEGMILFIGHVVRSFDIRKMWFDLPEYNEYLVPDGGGLLTFEGRLREFYYYDGKLWDRLYYSLSAERFRDFERKLWRLEEPDMR
jgi:hypothetical protein